MAWLTIRRQVEQPLPLQIVALLLLLLQLLMLFQPTDEALVKKQAHSSSTASSLSNNNSTSKQRLVRTIYKKIQSITVSEHLAPGQPLVDLRRRLVDDQLTFAANDSANAPLSASHHHSYTFKFEWFNYTKASTRRAYMLDTSNHIASLISASPSFRNLHTNETQRELHLLRTMFRLDASTGLITTLSSLDLEPMCDQYSHICQHHHSSSTTTSSSLSSFNSTRTSSSSPPAPATSECSIRFLIEASRYSTPPFAAANEAPTVSSDMIDTVYVLSFYVIIKDVNEYAPSFSTSSSSSSSSSGDMSSKQALPLIVVNVSEEATRPLRIELGPASIAHDRDCNDRQPGALAYHVQVASVNGMAARDYAAIYSLDHLPNLRAYVDTRYQDHIT